MEKLSIMQYFKLAIKKRNEYAMKNYADLFIYGNGFKK